MVRHLRWRGVTVLVAFTAVVCGYAEDQSDRQPTSAPPIRSASEPSPGIHTQSKAHTDSASAQSLPRHVRSRRSHAPTCDEVRRYITARYTVRTEPSPTGKQIWLELTLSNELDRGLVGTTGGILKVSDPDPGQPPAIDWGASSADDIAVRPHATPTRPIFNVIGDKLRASSTSKVTLVGVYTLLWSVGSERTCRLPAQMRAPRCLVTHHPSGAWFLTVKQGQHLSRVGSRRHPW